MAVRLFDEQTPDAPISRESFYTVSNLIPAGGSDLAFTSEEKQRFQAFHWPRRVMEPSALPTL